MHTYIQIWNHFFANQRPALSKLQPQHLLTADTPGPGPNFTSLRPGQAAGRRSADSWAGLLKFRPGLGVSAYAPKSQNFKFRSFFRKKIEQPSGHPHGIGFPTVMFKNFPLRKTSVMTIEGERGFLGGWTDSYRSSNSSQKGEKERIENKWTGLNFVNSIDSTDFLWISFPIQLAARWFITIELLYRIIR